jgi:hypothetical protein
MQMRSPTRQSAARIRQEPEIIPGTDRNEPNQLKSRRPIATAYTGTGNALTPARGRRRSDHWKVYS